MTKLEQLQQRTTIRGDLVQLPGTTSVARFDFLDCVNWAIAHRLSIDEAIEYGNWVRDTDRHDRVAAV